MLWKKSYVTDFGGSAWPASLGVQRLGAGRRRQGHLHPGGEGGGGGRAQGSTTGETVWKPTRAIGARTAGLSGQGYSSPVKATIGGTPMYVVLLGNGSGVVGVHAETGKVLWQYKGTAATGGTAQIPMPVVKDDQVWVSCSYSGGAALLQIVSKGKDEFEAKEVKAYKNPRAEQPPRRHGAGGRARLLRARPEQRQAGVRGVQDGRDQVGAGEARRPAGGGRRPCCPPTAGCTSATRTACWCSSSRTPKELKVVSSFKLPRGRPAVAPAELAAPGHRQRQALHPRPDRDVLLRREGEVTAALSDCGRSVPLR